MKRYKYLKSIDKYLSYDKLNDILNDHYVTPIYNRYKRILDISKKICDLRTFSNEEISKLNEYCEKNNVFNEWAHRRHIEKSDSINMILLWGDKNFFKSELGDNPYLYQTTASDVTYTITSQDNVLITKNFPIEILQNRFGSRYWQYLVELKRLLLNSEYFEELQEKISVRLTRDYFYERVQTNRTILYDIQDEAELINIQFILNRKPLFKVLQFDENQEGVHLFVELNDLKYPFEFKRYDILSEGEFERTIEEIIDSLSIYEKQYSKEDDTTDLEAYKIEFMTIRDQLMK